MEQQLGLTNDFSVYHPTIPHSCRQPYFHLLPAPGHQRDAATLSDAIQIILLFRAGMIARFILDFYRKKPASHQHPRNVGLARGPHPMARQEQAIERYPAPASIPSTATVAALKPRYDALQL